MLERHEVERGEFIKGLVEQGATQDEIGEELGLARQHIARLLDYAAVVEKLAPVGANFEIPTEREVRKVIASAARQIAEERGVSRVRDNREEVYDRAAAAVASGIDASIAAARKQLAAITVASLRSSKAA